MLLFALLLLAHAALVRSSRLVGLSLLGLGEAVLLAPKVGLFLSDPVLEVGDLLVRISRLGGVSLSRHQV